MPKVDGTTDAVVLKSFIDVLYLTNRQQMLPEIRQLMKQRRLSFMVLPIDEFNRILHRLELIGTVVIDAEDHDIAQHQKLGRIIESLEAKNIGAILLENRMEMPVRSFSLSPARTSFSMADTVELVSIDDLWFRIGVNLAYRKKNSGIVVKPATPPGGGKGNQNNKLAEQLNVTGAMVENLTEQLRLAGLVQRDFLPTQIPNSDKIQWATTFLPAEWVSGDIYDIVRIDEQHIGFYVADAVGHAMPAALLTIFVKQALVMRETVDDNYRIFSPIEVMKNLNVRMSEQKLSGYQFATCCYCLLNTETLQLTYARAGHPYPILIRDGAEPEQLEVKGSLLGIFKEAEYVQNTIQLQPGDKLLLYSDGAEPFIGGFDNKQGFNFKQGFSEIKHLSVVEMFDRFNTLVQNTEILSPEVDDITALGLEIL